MNASNQELLRVVAAEHGVALDRDDPLLVLQTATRTILEDSLRLAAEVQASMLSKHRSELELLATKTRSDMTAAFNQFSSGIRAEIRRVIEEAMSDATTVAVARIAAASAGVERRMRRHAVVAAVSAAAVAIATAAVLCRAGRLL